MPANEHARRRKLVFLVKPEIERENFVMAPPLGILYLGSALEKHGYSVRLIHERFSPGNEKKIIEEIIAADPLFVGISTFTGPSLHPSLSLSRKIKMRSSIPVVWGGLHASMLPEQTLEEQAIDVVVRGEGEETVVRLADRFAAENCSAGELAKIPGIAFRDGGGIQLNALPPFIENLDMYAPAWQNLSLDRYIAKGKCIYTALGSKMSDLKIATIMTSRGCPGRCGYCFNQFINKRTFRAHSIAFVVQQVSQLKKDHGVTGIIFEDDCFFTDRQRALAILREIKIPWSSSIRADYLARWGDGFVRELKESGCFELRIGAESGSQHTLEILHKDIRLEHLYSSVELCRKYHIQLGMGFMIGVPGESWQEMQKTFDLIDRLENMGVTVTPGPSLYFPYPGTPLFDEAVRKGFVPPAAIEGWTSSWGPSQALPPYLDRRARYAGYYRSIAMRRGLDSRRFALFVKALRRLARWRWQRRFFSIPVDYLVPRFFLNMLRSLGLKRMLAGIYDE